MIGRLGAEVLRARSATARSSGSATGSSISAAGRRAAATSPSRETGATVVPLCGGYWFSGPGPRAVPADRRRDRRRALRASSRRASSTIRPRSARSSPTPAFAGSLDLWDRLDVAAFGIGGPAWSDRGVRPGDRAAELETRDGAVGGGARSARSTSTAGSSATSSRDRTIAFDAARPRPRPDPDRRRRRRRRRSGRSSARCGRGADDARHGRSRRPRRWPRARRRGRGGRGGLMAATREAAVLGDRPRDDGGQGRPRRASTAGCSGSRGRATRTDADAATGRAEQDPEAWWGAHRDLAVRELTSATRRRRGLSRSGSTATARRSSRSTPTAAPTAPRDHLAGHRARPRRRPSSRRRRACQGWTLAGLPAALWLERQRAGRRCRDVLVPRDVGLPSRLRLTGRATTSLVEASRSRPRPRSIGPRCLPPKSARRAFARATVLGELTPSRGATTSACDAGIPVVAGIVDAWASFHGAGMTAPGDAIDVGGSAGGFGVYWDRPLDVPGIVLDDRAAARACSASAGRWPRPAARSTGSGLEIVGRRRLDRGAHRGGRPRSRPAPTASSSCRTSRASARRSGIRRRAARVRRA